MAVPGDPVGRLGSSFEHDPRNDPSPPIPRPLPERGRNAGRAAVLLLIAALIVVVLIALL
jgi:hypothetical protein